MITLTKPNGDFLIVDNTDETVQLKTNKKNDLIIESKKGTLVIGEGAEQELLQNILSGKKA